MGIGGNRCFKAAARYHRAGERTSLARAARCGRLDRAHAPPAAIGVHCRVADSRSAFPLWRWAAVLAPGVALYFAPVPGLADVQRHLLAVFAATIVALMAQPVPMGVSVLVALTLIALTRTVPYARALAGFGNQTVWLIVTAFLFARAVTVTGFGLRVAYLFIRRFGHSALTLGYSLGASNLVLAPFVPSDTARGGGIIFPIARGLAQALHAEPGGARGRLGGYLMLAGFHSTYTTSAMFLTGMASNSVIAEYALKLARVELSWGVWAAGAALPGLLTLLLMPYVIYRLHPPEVRDTADAQRMAGDELRRMGPMSRAEQRLVAVMLGVMAGWVTSPWHGAPNTFVALAGVSALLLLNVVEWRELLAEHRAWDALIWFAPLLTMADQLNETGVIRTLSSGIFSHLHGWPWVGALAALALAYYYIHYGFASMTAHVMALYPGFLGAALLAGAPPLAAALVLAYFSNLNAGLTHYGTGSAPVFFGADYVSQGAWWKVGLIVSLLDVAIWLGVGSLWWKLLGWW
jgi:divalent anion:Na+ symporter, DASS family